jgi:hypothetical protein
MGIEEIKKLIDILKGDLISIFQVDIGKVKAELGDLDMEEKIKLVVALGYSVLEILEAVQKKNIVAGLIDYKTPADPFKD